MNSIVTLLLALTFDLSTPPGSDQRVIEVAGIKRNACQLAVELSDFTQDQGDVLFDRINTTPPPLRDEAWQSRTGEMLVELQRATGATEIASAACTLRRINTSRMPEGWAKKYRDTLADA